MSSSFDALKELSKWADAKDKPKIMVCLSAAGVVMYARGSISMEPIESSEILDSELILADERGVVLRVSMSLLRPAEEPVFKPPVDAPMDFFLSLAFELPFGTLDMWELADKS